MEATSSEAAGSKMEIENKDEVQENIEIENDETNDENPQQRQDFTSESYKVEVNNMGKFSFGEFRSLIKKLKLKPTKMKTKNHHGGKDHAYLCFRTIAEKDEALKIFDGFVWRGRKLHVKEAKPSIDPVLKRRLAEENADENARKSKKFKRKTVLEATAPLAHLPYDEQIKLKETECIKHLQAYARAVKKQSLELRPMIQAQEKDNGTNGMPCIWHGIKESPNTNGYRNKCEFAIGKDENGEKTVGFRLGSYCDGSVEVGSIQDLPHVPERTKLAVKLFEAYIKSSKFEVFSVELYTGQFRQLSVRVSETSGEVMLIVGVHTAEIPEKVEELTKDIVDYFTEREGKELDVTSIYIEEMNKREVGQTYNKIQHVYGSKYINDTILGLKFRISAAAFFQINTKSAEVLYELAMKMGKIDSNTSMLDICCGTGTIGLCFAKHCKEVLGVEIIEDAIKDAKFNAEENGIENSKFYAGNCDDYIHSLVYEADNENLLAVLDPPRAGIQPRSKEALRNARGLNRIIYIACNPKAAMQNWIDFSRPCSKTLKGEPFILKEAAAVDMFPHTDHIEMVLLFERLLSKPKTSETKNETDKTEKIQETENA